MELIDIGANLADQAFASDRERVIGDAVAAGLSHLVVTGSTEAGSTAAADLAALHPHLLSATAGVHPHHARQCTDTTLDHIGNLCSRPEVRAVGECGLDFHRDLSPRPVQERWLVAQLNLAAELELPVFLHERESYSRFAAILSEWRPRLRAAVVHCFTGEAAALRTYLDLDLHIGITGWICDERRGLHLRDLVPTIPDNRLMIESDAPYLIPRTIRPKPKTRRNEPKWLPHVLETVAACRGQSPAATAAATTATARAFFAIP